MSSLSRHKIDPDLVRKQITMRATILDATLNGLPRDASLLSQLATTAQASAVYRLIVEPELPDAATNVSPDICRELSMAAKAFTAIFRLASAPPSAGERVPVEIAPGQLFKLPPTGPNSASSPGNWLSAFYLSAICRDGESLDWLAQVPIAVLTASSTRAGDYQYHFVEALQAYAKRQLEASFERLNKALEETEPERVKVGSVDYALNVVVPEIELLYRLLLGEEAGFNTALEFAIQRHQKYWTGSADKKLNPLGFVAFGPLALSCLAQEMGIQVYIDSDYLPRRLVQGACRD